MCGFLTLEILIKFSSSYVLLLLDKGHLFSVTLKLCSFTPWHKLSLTVSCVTICYLLLLPAHMKCAILINAVPSYFFSFFPVCTLWCLILTIYVLAQSSLGLMVCFPLPHRERQTNILSFKPFGVITPDSPFPFDQCHSQQKVKWKLLKSV